MHEIKLAGTYYFKGRKCSLRFIPLGLSEVDVFTDKNENVARGIQSIYGLLVLLNRLSNPECEIK